MNKQYADLPPICVGIIPKVFVQVIRVNAIRHVTELLIATAWNGMEAVRYI